MNYLIGILILGLVVLFHEFGHFLLAKLNHIKVLEFALGMGPMLFSFQKGETVYALRALPFGGSCTMLDEDEGDGLEEGSFIGALLWRRALVVAAGPVFNFILAFLISVVIISISGADPATVVEVAADSADAQAGLLPGDRIVRFNGSSVLNARDLYMDVVLNEIPADQIEMTVVRDGKRIELAYAPEVDERYMLGFYYGDAEAGGVEITMLTNDSSLKAAGAQIGDIITSFNGQAVGSMEELQGYLAEHPMDGSPVDLELSREGKTITLGGVLPKTVRRGLLGFSFNLAREKQPVGGVIAYSFGETAFWVKMVWESLAGLAGGTYTVNDLSGPVGIVKTVGDTAAEVAEEVSVGEAVLTVLSIMSMISANLGVMNLIPLPALDGGRLFLMAIEAIRRKPVNRKIEAGINFYGLLILLVLMVYITIHDILKLF